MSPHHFEEIQYPPSWVFALVAIAFLIPLIPGILVEGVPVAALLPLLVIPAIPVLAMPMETRVDDEAIRVRIGVFRLFSWTFHLGDISSCEAVSYAPMRTYLGWGIRRGFDGSRALTMRGDRAVRLVLASGRIQLIGSQQADELARLVNDRLIR